MCFLTGQQPGVQVTLLSYQLEGHVMIAYLMIFFFYPEKKSFILRKLHIWASGVTAAAGDVLLSLQSWPLLNTQQVHHIIFYWSYTGKKNWSLCFLCDGFLLLWLLNVSGNRGGEKKEKQHPAFDWGTDTETWHLLLPTIFHWVKFSKSTATEISSESWSEVSNMTGNGPSSHQGWLIYRSQTQELCWSDPGKTRVSHPWITCMEAWVAQNRAGGAKATGRTEMEGQGKGSRR